MFLLLGLPLSEFSLGITKKNMFFCVYRQLGEWRGGEGRERGREGRECSERNQHQRKGHLKNMF